MTLSNLIISNDEEERYKLIEMVNYYFALSSYTLQSVAQENLSVHFS